MRSNALRHSRVAGAKVLIYLRRLELPRQGRAGVLEMVGLVHHEQRRPPSSSREKVLPQAPLRPREEPSAPPPVAPRHARRLRAHEQASPRAPRPAASSRFAGARGPRPSGPGRLSSAVARRGRAPLYVSFHTSGSVRSSRCHSSTPKSWARSSPIAQINSARVPMDLLLHLNQSACLPATMPSQSLGDEGEPNPFVGSADDSWRAGPGR